jgi:hypothetical protein
MNRFLISKGRTAAGAAAALGGGATPKLLPPPLRNSASTVSFRTIRHLVSVSASAPLLDNDSVSLDRKLGLTLTTSTLTSSSFKQAGNRYSPDQNRNHTKSGGVPLPKQQQQAVKKNDGMLRLQMCWTPYDLEAMEQDDDNDGIDEEDEYMFVKAKFDLKDIKQKAKEMFESSKDLEYHDGEEWKPLNNIQDLSKYRSSSEPVPIRVPDVYDEDGYNYADDEDEDDESYKYKGDEDDDDDDDDEYRYGEPKSYNAAANQMKRTIYALVQRLQAQGYTRCPDGTPLTLFHTATGKKVSTATWILSQAMENSTNDIATIEDDDDTLDPETLETLLLGHVGALQHMAQCLDYDKVWQPRNDDSATIDAQTV